MIVLCSVLICFLVDELNDDDDNDDDDEDYDKDDDEDFDKDDYVVGNIRHFMGCSLKTLMKSNYFYN